MTTSALLPVLAVLASLSGALLIAGLVGTRARAAADRPGHDAPRAHALLRIGAWWLVAGAAGGARRSDDDGDVRRDLGHRARRPVSRSRPR